MQSTLRGLVSWLIKVAVLGSMTLWCISSWPIVSAQTVLPEGCDFVVIGDRPCTTKAVDWERHFERLIAAIKPALVESA